MRQLADAHRAQGDIGAEIRHHRAILAQWPLDRDALDALHRCYSEQEDWVNLAELLRDTVLIREQGDEGPKAFAAGVGEVLIW